MLRRYAPRNDKENSSVKSELSYEKAGVNIDLADATKRDMAKSLATRNARVLNKIGAFAALFDGSFPDLKQPVLVLKTEEPGSKQLLAFRYNRLRSICADLINHLVNDIAVMGATPLAVQDAIICGKLEQEKVNTLVDAIAKACQENECVLTGGETSEQPGVLEEGRYILTSSIVGVVEKDRIIDGSKIQTGDVILAIASNGLHTNGYSLVRALMAQQPEILEETVAGENFLDVILKPHQAYYRTIKALFGLDGLHGMAHITGGGMQGNLNRILPEGCNALIDLSQIHVLPIFTYIKEKGNVPESDMLRTFNLGVGMTMVVKPTIVEHVINHLAPYHCQSYAIGTIIRGNQQVVFEHRLNW